MADAPVPVTSSNNHRRPSLSPPVPWTARLQLAILSAATDAARRQDGTVNRFLLSLLDPRTSPNPKPISGVRTSDLTIDPSRDLWIRVFAPSDSQKLQEQAKRIPVIVYFHGGGFTFFSPATRPYDAMCRRICREIGALVLSVNYRLAPESKYPAAYDDGMDVLSFIDSGGMESLEIVSGLQLDLGNCFLAGDSAGGNIVHHVALRWATSNNHQEKVRLRGIMAIQAFFGGEKRTDAETKLEGSVPVVSIERCDWSWKAFLPEGADRDHDACHVFASTLEEGFPPALVVVGGYDPLQDWQRRYYEMLKNQGKDARLVEYGNAIHAFYGFPAFKESGQLIEEMKAFIEQHEIKDRFEVLSV